MSTLNDHREKYLRENCAATDEEMTNISSIVGLKRTFPSLSRRQNNSVEDPSNILDSWLFQGSWQQANDPSILQRLSITHLINVTERILSDSSREILHLPSKNGRSADLSPSFPRTNAFLDRCFAQGHRVLVHCERGISRSSTIILAFLMHHNKWNLKQAFEYLLSKRPEVSPNRVLLLQLIRSEKQLINADQ